MNVNTSKQLQDTEGTKLTNATEETVSPGTATTEHTSQGDTVEFMTFRNRIRARLDKQGEKIDKKFLDRPMAKERYERLMTFIGALTITYLVLSLMCVIKVIGEWW